MSPTNGFLSKELLATAGALLCAVAVSWGALNADVMALEEKAAAVEKEQKELASSVNEIKTSIEVIKTEQTHIKKDLEERGEDIKWIRKALETHYPNGR
jgi:chromosome segregation ATPase